MKNLLIAKSILLLVLLTLYYSPQLKAQDSLTVSGKVTDENGKGLAGATVVVKGTSSSTITAEDGSYKIMSPSGKEFLVFSYVGVKSQEIAINNRLIINQSLTVSGESLDDVIVVGYGKQRKETVTGAISTITTNQLKQSPAANLSVALAGRLPGLTTIQTSGQPGQELTNLYLRGQGTVNGQSPLILVDGVPRDISIMDPNEVESISILKDASATAVFGVRGANGVILVTTKRGRNEKPHIELTFQTGMIDFTRDATPVHSWEYAELRNQALINDGKPIAFTDEQIAHFRNQDEPDLYPDMDWVNLLRKKYTPQTRYDMNISGGTDKASYFVNVGYLNQGGMFKTDQKEYDPSYWMKRYNFRSNIDLKLNKTLSAFLNLGGYLENANQSFESPVNILAYSMSFPATYNTPLAPNGDVVASGEGVSPYGMLNRSGYRNEKRANVTASFGMKQQLDFITPGLSTKLMASFDTKTVYSLMGSQQYKMWYRRIETDVNGDEYLNYIPKDNVENSELNMSSATNFASYSNFQWSLDYDRTFAKDHQVTGLFLAQREERVLPGQLLPYRMLSMAGRATYAYKYKYFAEFNAGYNGSEQFSEKNRFGFFPSFSAGWLVSKENFLQNNNVISLLKLRASWGMVGNDNLGSSRFIYLDDIKEQGGGFSSSLNNGNTINELFTGNQDIRWEVAKKLNFGLELGFLNQIELKADIYSEKRDNVLITRGRTPSLVGVALPPVNIGVIENKGFELELNYHKTFTRYFSINATANFNHALNKYIYADEPELDETYAYRYRQQGYILGQPFGYITEGYWTNIEEINNSGLTFTGTQPRPGDFKYKDLNGDKAIDDKDYAPIGYSRVPQYTFGTGVSVTYKNFDLSILFQGTKNASNYFGYQGLWEGSGSDGAFYEHHLNAWTPERAAKGEKITYPALTTSNQSASQQPNSFFIQDISYLRLKNLEIGYTLPESWTNRARMGAVRFFANGLNLITWDNMIGKNFDPEVDGNYTYPMTRVINFGVNVNFK